MNPTEFPLNEFVLPAKLEELIECVWYRKLCSWRSFILCIDGRDAAGKSTIARYLSFRLNMPVIESDLYLLKNGEFEYHSSMANILKQRLKDDRPLIFEGVFSAQALSAIDLAPDYLIRLESNGHRGNFDWESRFNIYENTFKPNCVLEYSNPWLSDATD